MSMTKQEIAELERLARELVNAEERAAERARCFHCQRVETMRVDAVLGDIIRAMRPIGKPKETEA